MKLISGLLIFQIFFFFSSCKKSEAVQDNIYEIKLKKDGISETLIHNYCAIQKNINTPSQTDFFLTGKSKDNKINFSIVIQLNGDLMPGTYKTGGNHYIGADYFVDQGQPNERLFSIDNAPGKPDGYFTVTITSIDDKVIKGNFSGNYLYDFMTKEFIVITDGSFVAKRHK